MIYPFVSSDFCLVMMTGVQNLQTPDNCERVHQTVAFYSLRVVISNPYTKVTLAASIWPIQDS